VPFPNAVAALRLPIPSSLRLPSIQSLKVPLRWPQLRLPPTLPSAPGPSRRPIVLPVSTAAVVLLLVVPTVLLSRWSRPRAEGVEQLMGAASLLQSFPATPNRPIPALWIERLGPEVARDRWRAQRKVWWQFWATHSESAPFLAFPIDSSRNSAAALPANALRVGDLLVFAENPTARQQLLTSLRPLQRRSQGLTLRCRQRLQAGQAVFWQADALGTLLGPIAPLLERYQVGCLTLALEDRGIRWQGEAASESSGFQSINRQLPGKTEATPPEAVVPGMARGRDLTEVSALPEQPPLPDDLLLEFEGSSLDQLLEGLLARQVIRDPLASRYGLEGPRLAVTRKAPFRLRLHPLPEGPFQASLDLLVRVDGARSAWSALLERVRTNMLAQGFVAAVDPQLPLAGTVPSQPKSDPSPAAQAPPDGASATVWKRTDGTTVGGWRWLQGSDGQPQLLLFLGPPPTVALPMAVVPAQGVQPSQLALRVRPAALDALGLLPEEMPALARRASQVWIDSDPDDPARPRGPISLLSGRLQVQR
jgi:hypothetical protein